jgi:hypothetical protein
MTNKKECRRPVSFSGENVLGNMLSIEKILVMLNWE